MDSGGTPVALDKGEIYASLISYPANDSSSERLIAWRVCEMMKQKTCFHLFDNDRRIEILKSGLYRVHLYLEPVDSDVSKYYLEINGSPVPSQTPSSSAAAQPLFEPKGIVPSGRKGNSRPNSLTSSSSFSSSQQWQPFRDDVAVKASNVFEMRLNKWDMLVVRRKPSWTGSYGGRSPFGRLLLQAVRTDR
ncbi:hypothetical protein FI667_g6841, partial [Globisporangium splendens]